MITTGSHRFQNSPEIVLLFQCETNGLVLLGEMAVPHIYMELDEQLFALQQSRTLCGGAEAQRSFHALMLRPIEWHRSAYRPMGLVTQGQHIAQKTKKLDWKAVQMAGCVDGSINVQFRLTNEQ
jgi:hypothetical protein